MKRDKPETESPGVELRRILVALDTSPGSLRAIEHAAELAAEWKMDLLGLFVEDIDLLRLASAASATRFLYPTACEESLSVVNMESELRALAERARRELSRAAAQARVQWSFRTVRGRLPAEILLAASEVDLLSLGGARWSRSMAYRPPTVRGAAAAGVRPETAPARRRWATVLPVLVVYDGSRGREAAFLLAARLAETYGSPLTVLLPSASGRLDRELEAEVLRLPAAAHLQIRFRAIDTRDKSSLLRVARTEQGDVLVVSGQCSLLDEGAIQAMAHETDKFLLIVGGRSGPADSMKPKAEHSPKLR